MTDDNSVCVIPWLRTDNFEVKAIISIAESVPTCKSRKRVDRLVIIASLHMIHNMTTKNEKGKITRIPQTHNSVEKIKLTNLGNRTEPTIWNLTLYQYQELR